MRGLGTPSLTGFFKGGVLDLGPHQSRELILNYDIQIKSPALQERRTGHPKVNFKGRATRP
jgi:hypothetical protein